MIEHLLQQDCEIIIIQTDRYGDVIESEPFSVKCRATESFEMVRNNAGIEVVSSIRFWFPKDVDIDVDTLTKRRIRYEGKDYTPISVRNRRDTYGQSIFKVVNV
ncbi:hypothetical protein NSQ77_19990 [Oceanobacillus sp. FSL K6-2867]|uniref:hypothetical protein n=1 Tax=Oceanobacillus sp. FSL K6-2867 TaxID=2954748 RepID=UPI0030DC3F6D